VKAERLCIFTRYPEPGTTKTRLIPALGVEAAVCLQQAMTTHVLTMAAEAATRRAVDIEVRFEGGDRGRMREQFGKGFSYRPQGNGDLGDRMHRCFHNGFTEGARAIVVAGSDVPGIDNRLLDAAFAALRDYDLVIGPANDGGYYLIGLRREIPELFQSIPWGTESVFRRTLELADRHDLAVHQLSVLSDVDRPEDLSGIEKLWGSRKLAEAVGRISVIIPTLNEASRVGGLVRSIHAIDGGVEIVVVDGGSIDGTVEIARGCAVTVLTSRPGRAGQMNAGAAVAKGGMLLFLHADTCLPEGFPEHVRGVLHRPGVAAGAFRFELDAEGLRYRILERLTNWRARVLRMPYGDQALFMKASVFRSLGGFPDLPIMEDYEMVRRLKRRGCISILPVSATTSARRWQGRGFLQTTLLHQLVIAGYMCRVPPVRLARLYRRNGQQCVPAKVVPE